MVSKELVYQARRLYKELYHLGKNYPDPAYNFHTRLRGCFSNTSSKITNDEEMKKAIAKADFVKKEVEALIFLSKYRSMKRRYGPDAQQ